MLRREVVRLRAALSHTDRNTVIAKSRAMRQVLDTARRAAATNVTVLLTGETGTGKSVLAQYIHDCSQRCKEPFLQINCAALPAALAESELFGVRKGAYTDAREDREGVFVAAGNGTLFLDEIAELSLEAQAKLLRALDAGMVRPVVSDKEIPFRARLLTATNRQLEPLLKEGRIRPDLYYRIHVLRIEMPALRERREDIPPLVDAFLEKAGQRHGRRMAGVSASAMRLLMRHSWPGNVRELLNVVERAVAMAEHDVILPEDLAFNESRENSPDFEQAISADSSLEAVERAYIRRVLEAHGGNKAAAAKVLGITRKTLYRKLEGS